MELFFSYISMKTEGLYYTIGKNIETPKIMSFLRIHSLKYSRLLMLRLYAQRYYGKRRSIWCGSKKLARKI